MVSCFRIWRLANERGEGRERKGGGFIKEPYQKSEETRRTKAASLERGLVCHWRLK